MSRTGNGSARAARLGALALLLATAAPAGAEQRGAARPRRSPRAAPGTLAPVPAGPPLALRPLPLHPVPAATGHVVSVAGGRAYLDAGARSGLATGQRLVLSRRAQAAGACTVDAVADHSASCAGAAARPGDAFALAPAADAPATAAGAPRALPALVPPDEAARRRAAVERAPLARVEFAGAPAGAVETEPPRVDARLAHASWLATGAGAVHQERLDARIQGAQVLPGWRLWLDASGVYRATGADAARFRTGDSALLEVRELQLASRDPGQALAIAVGRVRPWNAPGSTVFDGAQVGWRAGPGELGVFGGAVPDVATTGLTTSRSTAGAYGAVERGDDATLLRGEGRVALVRSPELGARVEAEALGHAWAWRRLDVSAQARLGFGDRSAPGALDAAQLDLSARLADPLWVTAGYRYVGLLVPDAAAPAFFPGPAHHADATAALDVTRGLTLRLTGGLARDTTSGLERRYGGPELVLARLFGAAGGMSAGWLEEGGWAGGRTIWVQANATPARGLRLLGRVSWFVDERPAPLEAASTLGGVLTAALDLSRAFTLSLSALARGQLSPAEEESLGGVSIVAALDGRF